MSNPNGWIRASIQSRLESEFPGEWGVEPVFRSDNARVLRATDLDADGHIDYESAARRRVSSASLGKKQLRDGDLVLEAAGGGPGKPVGHVGVFCSPDSQVYLTSNFFRTLRPNDTVLPRYLWWRLVYLIQEPRIWAYQQQTTGITNLKVGEYLSQQLDWPPLPEQCGIANILDTADEAILKAESLIAKLRVIKQGLLHDLLTRGLDENGELRGLVEHPEHFQESSVGRIPRTWTVASVREAGEVLLGRQRSPRHHSGLHTTPYLRVANVFDGWIDYSDILSMDFTPEEKQTFWLRPGDILLNEGQSLELVGRSAVFDGPPNTYCFQNTLICFRAYEPNKPWFFRAVFKRCLDTGRFARTARQTTSVAHLGADRLAKMQIAVPLPDEQQAIADRLAALDDRIATEEACLLKLKDTKKGLMQDLLTGRVRVKAAPEMAKAEKER